MSDGVPLPPDVASDAQTFENLLRELNLDQRPRSRPIVRHIYPHFVKQSPVERRDILTWLREVISGLASEYIYPSNYQLAHLDRYLKFLYIWSGVICAERCNVRQPDSICISEIFSEDVQNNLISRMSGRVLTMYGFGMHPKPKGNDAIQRIQDAYLAFSITEKARAVLKPDKLKAYEFVLNEFMKFHEHKNFDYINYDFELEKTMSSDFLSKLSEIVEPHKQLTQLLMEIPWYHSQKSEPQKSDEPDWDTWDENYCQTQEE